MEVPRKRDDSVATIQVRLLPERRLFRLPPPVTARRVAYTSYILSRFSVHIEKTFVPVHSIYTTRVLCDLIRTKSLKYARLTL